MSELLTTEEAAEYLRLSERKLYELVATGAVPSTKVTGRWLFPKAALDRWVMAGLVTPLALAQPAPAIVGGSHDPLLEWALRESGSGLATLPEGSEAGLRRLARGEVVAAAIHLHRTTDEGERPNAAADEHANTDAVSCPGRRRCSASCARLASLHTPPSLAATTSRIPAGFATSIEAANPSHGLNYSPRAAMSEAVGEVAEWLKALAWKACIRETVSWVRIPPSPPRLKILIQLQFRS